MSGQYKIMYSSMDQFYDQTNGRMAEWVSQLEPWVKACENLGNMECYQGKSAESVKTYLKRSAYDAAYFYTAGNTVI